MLGAPVCRRRIYIIMVHRSVAKRECRQPDSFQKQLEETFKKLQHRPAIGWPQALLEEKQVQRRARGTTGHEGKPTHVSEKRCEVPATLPWQPRSGSSQQRQAGCRCQKAEGGKAVRHSCEAVRSTWPAMG